MKNTCYIFLFFIFLGVFSCNPTGKRQNVKRLIGTVFCLDLNETEKYNNRKFVDAKIHLFDGYFLVTSNSSNLNGLSGKWDLTNDIEYSNFIFSVDELEDQITSQLEINFIIGNLKTKLFFTICKK